MANLTNSFFSALRSFVGLDAIEYEEYSAVIEAEKKEVPAPVAPVPAEPPKSEAELALERANRIISEKQRLAKEYEQNSAQLKAQLEAKKKEAEAEFVREKQTQEAILKAAKAVNEAHTELENRKQQFEETVEAVSSEMELVTSYLEKEKLSTQKRVEDFNEWLNSFDS